MFPGPVSYSELRKLSRQRRFYALRFGFGILLLYFVIQTYTSLRWMFSLQNGSSSRVLELTVSETALLGSNLFTTVFWMQTIAVLFLTPALLAGSVAEDRQRRVLLYLLASPLNSAEIVLGKVAARLFNVLVIVASCFPIVSLALLFGGIDPMELALTYAGTLSTIYFLAGVSIAVSTLTARPREAILRTFFWELFWLGWPILDFVLLNAPTRYSSTYRMFTPVLDWFTDSSPSSLIGFRPFGGGSYLEDALWMMGLQLVYGTLLLVCATLRLRPIERGSRLFFRGPFESLAPASRRLWGRKPCGDRPMIWKECTGAVIVKNPATAIVTAILLVAALGGLGYLALWMGRPALQEIWSFGYFGGPTDARDDLNVGVRILTAVIYVLMLFMLAGVAATSFTSEREKDAWISLIATPLEGSEIITGKFLGSLWRVRYILGLLLLIWSFGLVCGAVHPLCFLLIVGLTAMDVVFVACVGCYVSLRMTSSARALAVTIGILLVLKGGYLFCCIPVLPNSASPAYLAGVTPFIVTFATGTYVDVRRFYFTSGRDQADWTAVVLLCLMFHTVAAGILSLAMPHQFEVEADRPDKGTEVLPEDFMKPDEESSSKPGEDGGPPA